MAMGRLHLWRPSNVHLTIGAGLLGAALFLAAFGIVGFVETGAHAGRFSLSAGESLGNPQDDPLRQTLASGRLTSRDFGHGDRRGDTSVSPEGPPLMIELEPFSGSDPARPSQNASLELDDHRTDILRMAALAHRRPYGELPRYVRQS